MIGYLQLSHQTAEKRFPKIFETVKTLKSDAKRILSFGCSTGEECFSLAEYFPEAEVVGVDIDYYTIQKARQNNHFTERVFFHTEINETGTFDLVTALMVLFSLEEKIPKEKWNHAIEQIDKHLNPDGLLAIYTSQYPFGESNVYENYKTIRAWKRTHPRNNQKYFCGYYKKKIPC